MNKIVIIPTFALILLLIDLYVLQGVLAAIKGMEPATQSIIRIVYWSITGLTLIGLFAYHFFQDGWLSRNVRTGIMVEIFTNYISKTFMIVVMLFDEIRRVLQWGYFQLIGTNTEIGTEGTVALERSELLSQTGLAAASVPILAIGWGIISGAHDYRVRRKEIVVPNLPPAFDGMRIGQLSDIHAGSFWNRTAVEGGIEMLNREKPDIVCFTGDLVNNRADEMRDYVDVFGKIKAPLGIYSVLGNHDYGDYVYWPSREAKVRNLQTLIDTHRAMGWNILLNEHHIIQEGDQQIAILGIENWSAKARFPKYGSLKMARKGVENVPVKVLLSHDPSHWMAEVVPMYSDITLTLSGHTHGMQFGIEVGDFRWSPVKYMYEQWADLYQAGSQYLYVNRGFGYLGFPGRIGILPEITIIELKRE